MPLINESYDSLPYIDAEPTPSERQKAQSLIDAELASSPAASTNNPTPHVLLPPIPQSTLSPLLETEMTRVASGNPLHGINLTIYEAQSAPPLPPDGSTAISSPSTLKTWRTSLSHAYVLEAYLSLRTARLEALERSGKDDWLSGNEELVRELALLERELVAKRESVDVVSVLRERAQREVQGELGVLEESWKRGVGRVVETELAVEGLKERILEARRSGRM